MLVLIWVAMFMVFRSFAQKRQQQPAAAGAYGDADTEETMSRRDSGGDVFGGGSKYFHRMQRAWREGDMAGVREFTTDHVFVEIQDRHLERDRDKGA